ncbi:MAG: PTS system mannose/fructose/sorbose family transporter subunit IID [bacterium]
MTTATATATPPTRVGRLVLVLVLWKSFFFLAAANYQRMQNVGFATCMLPALRRLYRGAELRAAVERHLEFFNSHPYMACAVLGAAVRMEEDIAAGTASPERVRAFKRTMMGPLAALGDGFFWTSLKPFGAAWAIYGVLYDQLWAPVAFLVLYNALHLGVRIFGIFRGYRVAEQVFIDLNRMRLTRLSDWAHIVTGAALGLIAARQAELARMGGLALGDGLEPFLLGTLIMISLLCLKRQLPMLALLYVFAGGCILFVVGLQAIFPILGS